MYEEISIIICTISVVICVLNSNQIIYHIYNDSFLVSLYTTLLVAQDHNNHC